MIPTKLLWINKPCLYFDSIRGRMATSVPGQQTEFDLQTDKEQIFTLITGLRAVPLDLIPEKSQYNAVRHFSRKGSDGQDQNVKPGQVLTLDRSEATKLMVERLVLPVDVNSWRVWDLLNPRGPASDKVKRMFDEPEPKKESWINKVRR